MAVLWVKASTQYATIATAAVSAYPCTMSVWVKTVDNTVAQNVLGIDNATSATRLGMRVGTAAGNSTFVINLGAVTTNHSTTFTTGWHHLCCAFRASANYDLYLDGSKQNKNTAFAFPTVGNTRIARDSGTGSNFDGSMADAAIWSVGIADDEATALFRGVRPGSIRPTSLVLWCPMDDVASPLRSYTSNAISPTITGSPTVVGGPLTMPRYARRKH